MSQKIFFAFTLCIVLGTSTAAAPNIVETALRDVTASSVAAMKDRIFSAPINVYGAEYRRRTVASLPEDVRRSRVTEGDLWQRVERVAKPVLQLHNREDRVELFLYRREIPIAMVWRGCALAISDSLASSLSDEELAGIVAHELAHAYFMDETIAAKRSGDKQGMRVVELKCDAVAMLTLKLMGSDPAKYASGLQRLTAVMVKKGYMPNSRWHPLPAERQRFSRRFIELLKG